jgi:16S rRNA (cytidine1402-2'-O)-methyltransferase
VAESSTDGKLYLVATPIGNLGDLSPRAAEILKACDLIACEDRRITGRILNHIEAEKPLYNYRDDNELEAAKYLLSELEQGKKIALVSDAGTPTISDPGFRIARLCRAEAIDIVPIPGPSAATTALSASGLPTNAFLFLGFLPPKQAARVRTFTQYLDFDHTLIIYESTHRIEKCLRDMLQVYEPGRCICVAKELTKMHEYILSGPIEEVAKSVLGRSTKGEFVVIIAPKGFSLES